MKAQREALADLMRQAGAPVDRLEGRRNRSRSRGGRRRSSGSSGDAWKGYDDRTVCQWYLCSVCPFHLLSGTKECIGRCTRKHDEFVRSSYLEARMRDGTTGVADLYEENVCRRLRDMLAERDGYIAARRDQAEKIHTKTTVKEAEAASESTNDVVLRIAELAKEAEEHTRVAEELGTRGLVKEAEEAFNQAAVAQRRRDWLRKNHAFMFEAQETTQSLTFMRTSSMRGPSGPCRPCEVCGARLPISAEEEFLAGHVNGKLHQAWLQLRGEYHRLRKLVQANKDSNRSHRPVATPAHSGVVAKEVELAAKRGASEHVVRCVAWRAAELEEARRGADSRTLRTERGRRRRRSPSSE